MATTRDTDGGVLDGRSVTWSSANTEVASVSSTGEVTALRAGTAEIKATSEGKDGSAMVTVVPPPVASVAVSLGASTLFVGNTTTATATLSDASGNVLTGRSVAWSSSDVAIATVSDAGVVTAVSNGNATIIATTEGKSGSATVAVVVNVSEVSVSLPQPGLSVGFSIQASATVKDASGNPVTGEAVTWSSSNTAVAAVNQSGVVTGVSAGSADITATSNGKTGSATIGIIVIKQQSLSAGMVHTCAISVAGDVYCWGEKGSGQFCDGSTVDRVSPVQVAGGLKFSAIAAKSATAYALTSDGRLFSWGLCDTPSGVTPRQVDTKRAIFSLAREVVGNCGIGIGNVAYCWNDVDGAGERSVVPDAPVPGEHAFTDVSGYLARENSSSTLVCGLTTDGAAYCWGYTARSLGYGPGGSLESSVPRRVVGNHVFKDIAVGRRHACGLTTAGQTYCWGDAAFTGHGPVGIPESCDASGCHTPVPVAGSHIFESITAGNAWTCGLTAAGDPYCWGQQPFGNAPVSFRYWSTGEAPDYKDPYADVKYRTVSPGGLHACATSTEGDVYCMNHQTYDGTDAADRARAVRKVTDGVKFRAP